MGKTNYPLTASTTMVIFQSLKKALLVGYWFFWRSVIWMLRRTRDEKCVAVYVNSGIGDCILALPLMKELATGGFHVIAIANPLNAAITRLSLDVHETHVIKRNSGFFGLFFSRVIMHIRKARKPAIFVGALPSNRIHDACVALNLCSPYRIKHVSPRKGFFNNFDFFFTHLLPRYDELHNAEANCELIQVLGAGMPGKCNAAKLVLPQDKIDRVGRNLGLDKHSRNGSTLVGFHPGCKEAWSFKRWPKDRYANLIKRMVRFGIRPILFGGSEEMQLGHEIVAMVDHASCMNMIGILSLEETIAAIHYCRMFISNDSGLMHIASVIGIPIIGLFCDRSHEGQVGPFGERHVVIKRHAMEDISVDDVLKEAMALVPDLFQKPESKMHDAIRVLDEERKT